MTRFPKPINLPTHVPQVRAQRCTNVVRSAKRGIFIRVSIIFAELLGFSFFNSSVLLVDAISSSIDVVTSILMIIFIKMATRPPDEDHPFGHGRYEPLAGLQMGLLLVLIGSSMLFQQAFQLVHEDVSKIIDSRSWIIPFAAVILLEICYRFMMKSASREHSPALASDALHYRIDALNSLLATFTLILAAYLPNWGVTIDHIGAILIAFLMVGIGAYAAKNNLHQLMDRTPENRFFETVRQAAESVRGVQGTEKIRIQLYGPDAHVDIDVEVDPQLSVESAHEISQKVRIQIQDAWPAVRDVTVHIEPYYIGDH